MTATDIFPRRKHRWLLLAIVLLVVYPFIGALYGNYFSYPIRWIWEHSDAHSNIIYTTYEPSRENFKALLMLLLVYDLWSYLIFVHLPFVLLFDRCSLYGKRYKSLLIFVGLYVFNQMVREGAIAAIFSIARPEEKLTFAILVAVSVYPFYYWVLHPSGSENESPYTDDDQVETRNSP